MRGAQCFAGSKNADANASQAAVASLRDATRLARNAAASAASSHSRAERLGLPFRARRGSARRGGAWNNDATSASAKPETTATSSSSSDVVPSDVVPSSFRSESFESFRFSATEPIVALGATRSAFAARRDCERETGYSYDAVRVVVCVAAVFRVRVRRRDQRGGRRGDARRRHARSARIQSLIPARDCERRLVRRSDVAGRVSFFLF